MEWTPSDIPTAKIKTGKPVPIPYRTGKTIPKLLFNARGIKLPKNNAAEIGQKERAKITPKANEPNTPDWTSLFCLSPEIENPLKFKRKISRRKRPTTMSNGPIILFIYIWKKLATTGTLASDEIITIPRTTYAVILPNVYAKPDQKTIRGWSIFFDKNETAATLVASGHGLMEVNIPNHNAESNAIMIGRLP